MSSIPQPTGMGFSVAAMVQTVHRAVVTKTYGGKSKAHLGTIASLALPLQKHIRQTIQQTLQSSAADVVDWEAQVLMPIIADFNLVEDLGVSTVDAEYIVLLSTVVILAFEVLLLPEVSCLHSTSEFLVGMFEQYFCEPEICRTMSSRLEEEQRRLVRAGADTQEQQAAGVLRKLMPDLSTRSVVWNKLTRVIKKKPSAKSVKAFQSQVDLKLAGSVAGPSTSSRPPSPRLTTFPRDLQVEIFLKPGCSMEFDFVDSVTEVHGALVVKTCIGLRMHVEAGYTVSGPSGTHDTVTLHERSDSDGVKLFAATVIVPPGHIYRITGVDFVSEMHTDLSQTLIETDAAVMNVSGGDYAIQCRDQRHSVLVESNELM